MATPLKTYFTTLGRDQIPARLGVSRSSIFEAERKNCAPSSWYNALCEWAGEDGLPKPDPSLFSFRDLLDPDCRHSPNPDASRNITVSECERSA